MWSIGELLIAKHTVYGSLRITRKLSIVTRCHRVARLMRKAQRMACQPLKYHPQGTDSRHRYQRVALNHIKELQVKHIDQTWVKDLIDAFNAQNLPEFTAAIDMHPLCNVGWTTSYSPAIAATLLMACRPRLSGSFTVHSSRAIEPSNHALSTDLIRLDLIPLSSRIWTILNMH